MSASPSVSQEEIAEFVPPQEELEIDKIFRACVKLEGSDLHLKVGKPPIVRLNGVLKPLNRGPIEDEEMVRLCLPMMDDRNRKIFEDEGGADFAHTVDVEGESWRFRVNLLRQMGHVGMVARPECHRHLLREAADHFVAPRRSDSVSAQEVHCKGRAVFLLADKADTRFATARDRERHGAPMG